MLLSSFNNSFHISNFFVIRWDKDLGDRFKRLKLRRCGKLDFTCNGKLRCCSSSTAALQYTRDSLMYCSASCTAAAIYVYISATVNEPQYTRYFFIPRVLRLVYCGDATLKYIAAAVHKLQYTTGKKVSLVLRHLVHCGTSAVDVEAPQFESFYMVPDLGPLRQIATPQIEQDFIIYNSF